MNQNYGIIQTIYLGNTIVEWVIGIGVALLTYIIIFFIKRILVSRLSLYATRTTTDIDDFVVEIIKKTKPFFLIVLSVFIASFTLTLSSTVLKVIQKVVVLGFLIQIIVWGATFIKYIIQRMDNRRNDENQFSKASLIILGYLGKLLLWSIVVLVALDNLGINITALIAGLGVGGIAVALAVQSLLADVLASLSIVFDKPFVIGDFIVVEDFLGTVEYIGLKTTRIHSLSGEQIIISNNDLLRCRIRNYKRMTERRVVFHVGVTYETPHDKLSRINTIIREIIETKEDVRFDRVHFKEYGDWSLIFEVVYFVLKPDYNLYMDIQQAINLDLFQKCEKEGIEFAYPTNKVKIIN
ncbi:MAG: mechanosensitive ion channel family protein [Melioribacteraceae bacterium]